MRPLPRRSQPRQARDDPSDPGSTRASDRLTRGLETGLPAVRAGRNRKPMRLLRPCCRSQSHQFRTSTAVPIPQAMLCRSPTCKKEREVITRCGTGNLSLSSGSWTSRTCSHPVPALRLSPPGRQHGPMRCRCASTGPQFRSGRWGPSCDRCHDEQHAGPPDRRPVPPTV